MVRGREAVAGVSWVVYDRVGWEMRRIVVNMMTRKPRFHILVYSYLYYKQSVMRRGGHSIYGSTKCRPPHPCVPVPCPSPPCIPPPVCPPLDSLFVNLETMIFRVEQAIQEFFPSITVVSTFIAQMDVRAYVPPTIFVRLMWRQNNPGVVFNIENPLQRLQIKDIYIVLGFDWTVDPMFIKYPT